MDELLAWIARSRVDIATLLVTTLLTCLPP